MRIVIQCACLTGRRNYYGENLVLKIQNIGDEKSQPRGWKVESMMIRCKMKETTMEKGLKNETTKPQW
jgi:hypothetical protein